MIFSLYKFLSIKKLKVKPIKNYPFISILIPARNEEENLPIILNSLKNLDYPNYEILIYDDESEDRTYEVALMFSSDKVRVIKGKDKPSGWIGKNYALYNLVKFANGEILIFLDADVEIIDREFIKKIVSCIENNRVITGFGKFEGVGRVILSIVPFLFSQVPITLGLNGQFWAIKKEDYLKHKPHLKFKSEVLEDVKIGTYLKFKGVDVKFFELKDIFIVRMYKNNKELIEGLTKNAYSFFGRLLTPVALILYSIAYIVPFFLISNKIFITICVIIFLNKVMSDYKYGFSFKDSLLVTIGLFLFGIIILRSWIFAINNRLYWKGRKI